MSHSLFCSIRRLVLSAAIFGSMVIAQDPVRGQSPQVFPTKPDDIRLNPLKDLNGYFPFQPPATMPEWEQRRQLLKLQVKTALGLVPEPTRTPLNAIIHGKMDLGDYTVEKVFFESMPGFYVTGNLYRPAKPASRMPGVLCPHGHWSGGRFYDAGEKAAEALVKQGGESDIEAARNHIQARCVHLARMGCVVFQYDMIGYADSVQISFDLAHRFAKQRPDYNGSSNWGLFSPQAELNLQSIMGLQTWNSIRAVDFLESLEGVDSSRLAVTGASGGGTQTFLLAAVDDRIDLSFPAVMVSTAMQGGCTCENCTLLRITTGNVELAGLFAPKPQGVTAANDWTKEMRTKGFPQLKKLYELYNAGDKLMLVDRTEFGHNYNKVSRTAMYRWLKKHFGLKASTNERPFRRLTPAELTVWNSTYPKPGPDPDFERRLLAWWHDDCRKKIESMKTDATSYREFLSRAWKSIFQREELSAKGTSFEATVKTDAGDYFVIAGPVRNTRFREVFPAVFIHPKKWNGSVAILTSEKGKDGLFDAKGKPRQLVMNLVARGISVVGADLFQQGEFTGGKIVRKTDRVKNPREAAAYTFGYNHSLFSHRTHDLATLLTLVANHDREPKSITLIGLDQTGAIAAAALTLNRQNVSRILLPRSSRDALDVNDIHSPYFLPGAARYGGVEGLLDASQVPVSWMEKADNQEISNLID